MNEKELVNREEILDFFVDNEEIKTKVRGYKTPLLRLEQTKRENGRFVLKDETQFGWIEGIYSSRPHRVQV